MCSKRVFVERAVESYCTPHTHLNSHEVAAPLCLATIAGTKHITGRVRRYLEAEYDCHVQRSLTAPLNITVHDAIP